MHGTPLQWSGYELPRCALSYQPHVSCDLVFLPLRHTVIFQCYKCLLKPCRYWRCAPIINTFLKHSVICLLCTALRRMDGSFNRMAIWALNKWTWCKHKSTIFLPSSGKLMNHVIIGNWVINTVLLGLNNKFATFQTIFWSCRFSKS